MKNIVSVMLALVFSLVVMGALPQRVVSEECDKGALEAKETTLEAKEAAVFEKININTASAEELAKLKMIGSTYAERIIQYREENGPFKELEDIMKVKGIGEKTWEAIKDRIVIE